MLLIGLIAGSVVGFMACALFTQAKISDMESELQYMKQRMKRESSTQAETFVRNKRT